MIRNSTELLCVAIAGSALGFGCSPHPTAATSIDLAEVATTTIRAALSMADPAVAEVTVRPPILSNVGGVTLQGQYVVVPVMWGTRQTINGVVSVRNDVNPTTVNSVQNLYDVIANSNYYSAIAREYSLASLSSVAPVVILPVTPPSTLSKDDILNELNIQINNSILMHYYDGTAPGMNGRGAIFVVHLPASVQATFNDLTYDVGFCAYHSELNGLVPVAVIPDNSTASNCASGWNAISSFESHEIIEAITDPDNSNGWRDNRQPDHYHEIGDICDREDTIITTPFGSANVQKMWSNARGDCDAIDGPIPPPIVKGVSPNQGPAGVATPITITGANFVPGQTTFYLVTNVVCSSPTSCTGSVDYAAAGSEPGTMQDVSFDVQAVTPYGTSPTSPADPYTFLAARPACTGVWYCGGANEMTTVALFTCDVTGTYMNPTTVDLFRGTKPVGYGTAGPGQDLIFVTELGYDPAGAQSISYQVCVEGGACSLPIALTSTENRSAPGLDRCKTCVPSPCASDACGTFADGCGGALSCSCSDGGVCSNGTCLYHLQPSGPSDGCSAAMAKRHQCQ
jgi:hypothetical protein